MQRSVTLFYILHEAKWPKNVYTATVELQYSRNTTHTKDKLRVSTECTEWHMSVLHKQMYIYTLHSSPSVGTAVAQWLRCCATNRKVAGSIPDGVIGIFLWHNPSDRTMALGSTQPLTEMSTRRISWGWRRPVREADNFTIFLCRCHEIWVS